MIVVIDVDASKAIEAVRSTGVVITRPMIEYAHYLISNMKNIGTWQLSNAVYGMIGGTAESHKFNWKDLRDVDAAFRLTYSGGITHSANGMQGDGISGYANTFLNPSLSLTTGNTHLSFYSNTNSANSTVVSEIGAVDGSAVGNDLRLIIRRSGDVMFATSSNSTASDIIQYSNANSIGYFIGNTLSNLISLRNNGILQTSTNQYSSGSSLPNVPLYLLAINQFDTNPKPFQFSTKRCAFSSIGAGLTGQQATQQSQIVTNAQMILNRA